MSSRLLDALVATWYKHHQLLVSICKTMKKGRSERSAKGENERGKPQKATISRTRDVMPDTRGRARGLPILGVAGGDDVHAGTTSAPQASLQLLTLPPPPALTLPRSCRSPSAITGPLNCIKIPRGLVWPEHCQASTCGWLAGSSGGGEGWGQGGGGGGGGCSLCLDVARH